MDFFDEIGFEQYPFIGNGRYRREQLQGGDGDALTDGHGRHIHLPHIAGLKKQTLFLARQFDACRPSESEIPSVFRQCGAAQTQADFDESRVEGHFDNIAETDIPVVFPAPVLNTPSGNLHIPLIIKPFLGQQFALIKGGGGGNGLEGGSGLINDGYGAVLESIGRVSPKTIGVETGTAGHGQYFPGAGIHDNGRHALGLCSGHNLVQALLDNELDMTVDGKVHAFAMAARFVGQGGTENRLSFAIRFHRLTLTAAFDNFVQAGFDSLQTDVINAHEAQHMGGEFFIGIMAFPLFDERQSPDMPFFDEFGDSFSLLMVKGSLQPHETAAATQPLGHILNIHAQNGSQPGGRFAGILVELAGIDIQRRRHAADGQLPSCTVVNGTPRRLQGLLVLKLKTGLRCQLRALNELYVCHSRPYDHESGNENQHKKSDPLARCMYNAHAWTTSGSTSSVYRQ